LTVLQTVPTIPPNSPPDSADIHLSPDCRFLYCSNRGAHSITVFGVHPGSGMLQPAGNSPSGGLLPRSFVLTPSGRHLLVGNQDCHSIAVFRRNPDNGELADTGCRLSVGSPVCVKVFCLGSQEARGVVS
jgi:6-phosphogluconolactonase